MSDQAQNELIPAISVEQKISIGLQAFETKKAQLSELAMTSKGVVVADIHDKKQLEAVSTTRKKLKAERVEIEKQGKALRDNVTAISKNISAKEKELVGIISPVEDELQAEEDRVNKELENVRLIQERQEQERLSCRCKGLVDNGCAFDGSNYSIEELTISMPIVKSMDDEKFAAFMEQVKAKNADILKAEAARVEAERIENERIAEEKKAEEGRLQKEREELDRQRKEFEEQQAKVKEEQDRIAVEQKEAQNKIDAENKRIADAQEAERQSAIDKVVNARASQLREVGLIQTGDTYSHPLYAETLVPRHILQPDTTDEQWPEVISLLATNIQKGADAAEAKRLQDISDAEERGREEQRKKDAEEKKRQEEDEKAHQAALARAEALAPDKEKLMGLFKSISDLPIPVCSTDEGKAALANIQELLTKTQAYILKNVKSL